MLKMKDVVKNFGQCRALDQLTLTVPKGAVYGLVGPNGAGKTTAIRHLTGIYRPDSGQITCQDQPVFENPEIKAKIGYIPDDVFFFPAANLEEMHRYYRGIYPAFDEELYQKLSELLQLPQKQPLRRLSRGMQKQAAFQLNLSIRPELLILDEPVDGLDPLMRRQIWNLVLSQVAQEEMTVLVSSHNLRELEDVCDHVGIMHRGKMLLERSLEELQSNVVKLQLVGQPPENLEVLHESGTGRLRTLIVRGTAEEVAAQAKNSDNTYFDVLPLSLEEIFIYELGGINDEIKSILL